MTRDEAIAIARHIPEVAARAPALVSARVETWGDGYWRTTVYPSPEPSRQVWVLNLAYEQPGPTGGAGFYVVIDHATGEILSVSQWIG